MSIPDKFKSQRSGPLAADEKKFIADNADTMNYEDIAANLRRNPDTIKKYIKKKLGKKGVLSSRLKVNPEYDIKHSPVWEELKKEFSDDELNIFLWHWARIIGQFKDDVFPTEELQVIDAIKLEILLGRALKQQRTSVTAIADLQKMLDDTDKDPEGMEKTARRMELHKLIGVHKAAIETLSDEYTKLLIRKESMLKDLKATRAERIRRIEDSKQTFMGWITELLSNREMRRELGLKMEKMRIAINLEEVRLMEPHKYADGTLDYPLLNSDTVEKIKQEDKKEEDAIS